MDGYEKAGYLNHNFKIFHIKDYEITNFDYHYHDFNKILIFLEGDVSYHIEGKHYTLFPQDIVLVHAGQIHKPIIMNHSLYERIIIYVSTDFMNSYKTSDCNLDYCFHKAIEEGSNVFRTKPDFLNTLTGIIRRLEQVPYDQAFASKLYQQVLFLEFLIELNRMVIANKSSCIRENPASNQTVVEIIRFISAHLTEELSIEKIAAKFFLNRYYLMHLFKKETGYTLGNFITQKRLLTAGTLLLNGYSATDACYGSGFRNYSTFSRAFANEFHVNPKNYSKQTHDKSQL